MYVYIEGKIVPPYSQNISLSMYARGTYIPRVGAWHVTTVMLLAFAYVFNVAAQSTEVTCPDSLSWVRDCGCSSICFDVY